MPKKIVLVRHGQAEARGPLVTDRQRRLTADGLAALERAYPAYFAGIAEEGEEVSVLSSAAVRTMETARAVLRAMGRGEDEVYTLAALTNQRAEAAIDDILSRDGVVVAVGHSPSIGEVASRLSGRMRMMLCGEAICLDAFGKCQGMSVMWDCMPS